jgi:hypothetical protein
MTGISGIGRIVQAIRAHGTTAQGRPSPLAEKITQEQEQARSSEFKAQAALRLKAISPEDPQRSRKAFRIFLEGTLADLLGNEAPTDPAFRALIDRVHLAMETDSELTVEMGRLADILLNGQ